MTTELKHEDFCGTGVMTEWTRERLVLLMEECAEVQKNVCKALRHGLDGVNPEDNLTNAVLIAQELGDVMGIADILLAAGTLSGRVLGKSRATKEERIKKWVHHV